MLAAFTPNVPVKAPKVYAASTNVTLTTEVPISLTFNTNHNPDSFGASSLPHGLSINPTNGNITGIPTDRTDSRHAHRNKRVWQ